MSLTHTPDNFEFESGQLSSGQTSRTTTRQSTVTGMSSGISSIEETISSLVKAAVKEKDEEIKRLKERIENLETLKEKEQKSSDSQITSNLKSKAAELKKVIDDFLEYPGNRPYSQRNNFPPLNIDVAKPSTSTNENMKFRTDEPSMNGTNHTNRNFNNQEDFGSRQEFRTESDIDIINQAELPQHYHPEMKSSSHNSHNGHVHNNLPTTSLNLNTLNNGNVRRFNNNNGFNNNLNGMNNNNNNRNRNNHNHNNNNKYTVFISWPGNMTAEQLRELFESSNIDVADIRYTSSKQFAHVDLKSEQALNKAMTLNGEIKNKEQGQLRVELGKPRSSNNNLENGQRVQNQNKNHNRQNNKNGNGNGFNSNMPQKHNNKYPGNYNHNNHNNHNNHHHMHNQFSFAPPDDKEPTTNHWGSYQPQDTKQTVEN